MHTLLDRRVTIKEYYFRECCTRDVTTSRITVSNPAKKGYVDKFRRKRPQSVDDFLDILDSTTDDSEDTILPEVPVDPEATIIPLYLEETEIPVITPAPSPRKNSPGEPGAPRNCTTKKRYHIKSQTTAQISTICTIAQKNTFTDMAKWSKIS